MSNQLDLTGFEIDGYPVYLYSRRGKFDSSGYKFLIGFLIKEYGVCYHCGIKVYAHEKIDYVPAKPDLATIDHLIQRPKRRKGEVVGKVLSCVACNLRLNTERIKNHHA